jgi:hypothetical protein
MAPGNGTILAESASPIVAWFYVSDGRLRYRGRITRQPFAAWAASPEGEAAIDAAASQLRFCLLGRARTARRRMWKDLQAIAASEAITAILEAEPDRYLAVWTELAYAPALPRVQVGLRRVVMVPRTMIAARALSGLTARLMSNRTFADLNGPLRAFFCSRCIFEMDEAIRRASPSPRKPVHAREAWSCVGIDQRFTWVDPLWSGPDWLGHAVLFEMADLKLSRRERREIETAIERLQASVAEMSVVQRDGTVRTASAAMPPPNLEVWRLGARS